MRYVPAISYILAIKLLYIIAAAWLLFKPAETALATGSANWSNEIEQINRPIENIDPCTDETDTLLFEQSSNYSFWQSTSENWDYDGYNPTSYDDYCPTVYDGYIPTNYDASYEPPIYNSNYEPKQHIVGYTPLVYSSDYTSAARTLYSPLATTNSYIAPAYATIHDPADYTPYTPVARLASYQPIKAKAATAIDREIDVSATPDKSFQADKQKNKNAANNTGKVASALSVPITAATGWGVFGLATIPAGFSGWAIWRHGRRENSYFE